MREEGLRKQSCRRCKGVIAYMDYFERSRSAQKLFNIFRVLSLVVFYGFFVVILSQLLKDLPDYRLSVVGVLLAIFALFILCVVNNTCTFRGSIQRAIRVDPVVIV
ncbi:hypothetical protein QR680_006079 [Steinernema hermaphroditum]|nr:hypothetical protein QR680_006079 [Steinernema hermaphroditum]